MQARAGKRKPTTPAARGRQVNFRVESALYRTLEAIAHQERRSVAQTAHQLLEQGLRSRTGQPAHMDDTRADNIADLAAAGGAFDWLAEEPDLYDDTSGTPI